MSRRAGVTKWVLVIVCRGYGTLHIDSVLLVDCASLWFTDGVY